jgi:hypothetical protein
MSILDDAVDRAAKAHHARYCLSCAQGKYDHAIPTAQEIKDVEVILAAAHAAWFEAAL